MASFLQGACPDRSCGALLCFPGHEASVECCGCGQRHTRAALLHVQPVEDVRAAAALTARRLLAAGRGHTTRGPENVKVLGSSNYHCKLLSPLLSTHGLEKSSGRARPLCELTGQQVFECGVLAAYAFQLDARHLDTTGFGRDLSGSAAYLRDTLELIRQSNEGEERLVPVHADGDGHCLVHALSRALTGRELFWHPLRLNMQRHLTDNLIRYQEVFGEFVAADDWPEIVAECDPDYVPPDGQPHGLRNLHVFALANVLRRPLVLLDSLSGMRSSGDYAALFLPVLVPPSDCRSGTDGTPNAPLCLAWSSAAHNHYIALVPVRDRKLPRLPASLLPKVWGVDQSLRDQYLTVADDACIIGSQRSLQDGYIQRLTTAMDHLFISKHGVHPELVADAHLHLFKRVGVLGYSPPYVCDEVRSALAAGRLYRCLRCRAVLEQRLEPGWLLSGGYLHRLVVQQHGELNPNKHYRFPLQGILCSYDSEKDCLLVKEDYGIKNCPWCEGTARHVDASGVPRYENGDVTSTPAGAGARCSCGLKHFWDGAEYDSPPLVFLVTLRWGNKVVREKVVWFEGETDESLNSNVYDTANQLVTKHFPGVFGIEVLVKQVVDQILDQTKTKPQTTSTSQESTDSAQTDARAQSPHQPAMKIIVTGFNTLHKEELGVSEAERRLRARIERNAPLQQSRASGSAPQTSPSSTVDTGTSSLPASSASSVTAAARSAAPLTATVAPAPDTGRPAAAGCRVRVVASDGRQADLLLPPEAAYGQFLSAVCRQLDIERASIMRVLHGFPPRQVDLPDDAAAPFKSGERAQVELRRESPAAPPAAAAAAAVVTTAAAAAPDPDPELEAGVQALLLASQLAGTDLWAQVQTMPRLFDRGGLFFRLAERQTPLTDGQLVRLHPLPGKLFRYSAAADALHISLEPFGGHPVSVGVERRVLSSAAAAAAAIAEQPQQSSAGRLHRLVSTGAARVTSGLHPPPPLHPAVTPFSGVGHTLGGATDASATTAAGNGGATKAASTDSGATTAETSSDGDTTSAATDAGGATSAVCTIGAVAAATGASGATSAATDAGGATSPATDTGGATSAACTVCAVAVATGASGATSAATGAGGATSPATDTGGATSAACTIGASASAPDAGGARFVRTGPGRIVLRRADDTQPAAPPAAKPAHQPMDQS